MREAQGRLFPDAQPLVERLGTEFFRQLPPGPGIYLMRGRCTSVLYVGKAKNLRKRLGSYRVANPERLPRRTLRLLNLVERITYEECDSESNALRRESELLLSLRPRFNRAGVWPQPKFFLVWRCEGQHLRLAIGETPSPGWQAFGPCGSGVKILRLALVRMLWLAANPNLGLSEIPVGWVHGRAEREAAIRFCDFFETALNLLAASLAGHSTALSEWIRARAGTCVHPFSRAVMDSDLEFIDEFLARHFQVVASQRSTV
jgi:predicted GIY-YIG superfamily endonuclease